MSLILMGAGVLLALLLIKNIYTKNWHKGIVADIDVSSEVTYPGEEITLTETITNRKWLPLPMILVKFEVDRSFVFGNEVLNTSVSDHCYKNDIFSLLFYQKIIRKLPLICTKRGFFSINSINIVSTDVMMDKTLAMTFPISKSITVYPAEVDSQDVDIPYNTIMGMVLTRQYAYEDPFEFRGIREYQTYDTLKSINWTASAKTGELKVNVHDYTASREVCIFLNLENDGIWEYEDIKEKSISMASSLACRLAGQGVGVSLISNGRDMATGGEIFIGSGRDEGHRNNIMTQLARVDLKKQARDFERTIEAHLDVIEKNSVFCMISMSKREDLQRFFEELSERTDYSVWVYPMQIGFDSQFTRLSKTELIVWEVDR